jgi:ABC-type lipoprotein export system ATPase subunit
VPAIKEARQRRQIIIVTHNPNLAVVCDAAQIIYAHLDKKAGNMVTYASGSIEHPVINRKIMDVLEGTRLALETGISSTR